LAPRLWARNFRQNGGKGIGVIGLCLTGNFAITLLADTFTLAPVAGEPSLPFGITAAARASMAVSDDDLARAQARNNAGVPLMCLRFSNDSISPPERFAAIAAAFAANFEGIVIPSPDAGWGVPANAHAVLTENFSDADGHPTRHARDRVVAFLKGAARLTASIAPPEMSRAVLADAERRPSLLEPRPRAAPSGDRWFESISLQQRVTCELDFGRDALVHGLIAAVDASGVLWATASMRSTRSPLV
jgi:hypothetical protein